eukprot:16032-Heterococcus_DN1.PRE.2
MKVLYYCYRAGKPVVGARGGWRGDECRAAARRSMSGWAVVRVLDVSSSLAISWVSNGASPRRCSYCSAASNHYKDHQAKRLQGGKGARVGVASAVVSAVIIAASFALLACSAVVTARVRLVMALVLMRPLRR